MKKLIAMMLSLVVVLLVGGSCSLNSDKETEAEYKARIKKELDAIPVEATGYKLVDPTKNDVVYPEGEEPQWGHAIEIDGHIYEFDYGDGYNIYYSLDKKEDKTLISTENEFFSRYRDQFTVFYYDKAFFIVRYRMKQSLYSVWYSAALPPILFYCDLEDNAVRYMGYLGEWFDYKIKDLPSVYDKIFTVVKN